MWMKERRGIGGFLMYIGWHEARTTYGTARCRSARFSTPSKHTVRVVPTLMMISNTSSAIRGALSPFLGLMWLYMILILQMYSMTGVRSPRRFELECSTGEKKLL